MITYAWTRDQFSMDVPFSTDAPASYDVASFTVEYQHYVPVA